MNQTEGFCGAGVILISKSYAKVHGYASLIVCLVGIIGNILNLMIFGRKEMISPVNIILRGLSASDLTVLIFYIPFNWYTFIRKSTERELHSYHWVVFLFFHSYFSQVLHSIGIWLTVVLAIWRYVAIAHPLHKEFWCNTTFTRRAVIAGYVICPLLCSPIIYSFRIQENYRPIDQFGFTSSKENTTRWYSLTMLEPADFLVNLNFIIYSILMRLVPSILLTLLNIKLIFALMETKKTCQYLATKAIEKEKQMERITSMIIAVLIVFLMNEIPQSVLILLVTIYGKKLLSECYFRMGDILDMLALINSSLHFFLYYAICHQYRSSFKQLLFRCTCQEGKNILPTKRYVLSTFNHKI